MRTRGLSVRPLRLRVPAPVRGHQREVQEGEVAADDLVPRHSKDQKENALLVKLRRSQEVPRRVHHLYPGMHITVVFYKNENFSIR